MYSLRNGSLALLVGFFALLVVGGAALAGSERSSLFPVEAVEELRLPNGMTFLLMKHGETPIFSGSIRLRVGGMDEPAGQTGLAHLIEHMAFKGTEEWGAKDWEKEKGLLAKIETVGQKLATEYGRPDGGREGKVQGLRKELEGLYERHRTLVEPEKITREIQRRGGLNFNATTSKDLTTYFVSLPTSELKFWAELEAARIFTPVFREFYPERDVVLEERRSRLVDNPFGALYTNFMGVAFPNSPYHYPTIGEKRDLLTATRSAAEQFFTAHYRPDNAVGAVVGQFSLRKLKRLLRATFGQIAPRPEAANPQKTKVTAPPYKRESCRVDLERPAQSRLMIGYHKPNMPHRDDYVFDLISTLLTEDRSSRLYQSLVMEKGLAVAVDAYAGSPGSRLPNLFLVMAVPRPGVPLDRLATEVEQELEKLKQELVLPEELQQAQKQLIDQQVWRLERNGRIASELSYFQALTGDWRYLVRYPGVIRSITALEIQQVAQKYFGSGNRCLGFLHGAGQ